MKTVKYQYFYRQPYQLQRFFEALFRQLELLGCVPRSEARVYRFSDCSKQAAVTRWFEWITRMQQDYFAIVMSAPLQLYSGGSFGDKSEIERKRKDSKYHPFKLYYEINRWEFFGFRSFQTQRNAARRPVFLRNNPLKGFEPADDENIIERLLSYWKVLHLKKVHHR